MKHAFSLLELLFVIVLIGIISGIGLYSYQPDGTSRDLHYALLKLKESRYRAIGYDALHPQGCLTLTAQGFGEANSSDLYEFTSRLTHTARSDTLCFDALGRPHDLNGSIDLESLTRVPIDVTFENPQNPQEKRVIRIFPQSGYAIILPKNG